MSQKLKEPRIYLCAVYFIVLFLPWMSIDSSASVPELGVDVSGSAGGISGFTVLLQVITGFIPIAYPIIMLVLEFVPITKLKRVIYLAGGILSVIFTFISTIFGKSVVGSDFGSEFGSVSTEGKMGFFYWLDLIILISIIVYTIVKDFALYKSIKEKGLKDALSDTVEQVKNETADLADDISSGGLSSLGTKIQEAATGSLSSVQSGATVCPNCGAVVAKGKKFCAKCGNRLSIPDSDEDERKQERKQQKKEMFEGMTVNEFILTLSEIKCEKCGASVESGKKFCPDCGERMVIKIAPEKCSQCGESLIKGKKFCGNCGTPVVLKELITNCQNCGAELIYGKKFCVECGEEVKLS